VTGEQDGRILVRNIDTREETTVELSVAVEQQLAQAVVAAVRREAAALGPGAEVTLSDLEGAVQQALREVGARCLEVLVETAGTGYAGPTRPCACGGEQQTDHYATASWTTVVGEVRIRRAVYHCPGCQAREIPLDARLGLDSERTSPLLRALLSRYCAAVPFAEACTLLHAAIGVRVAPKRAQVVSEAVGARLITQQEQDGAAGYAPMASRLYLGLDGVLYCTTERDATGALVWREAKIAVLYAPLPRGAPKTGRRSRLVADGPPLDVAAPQSHSYVVHMGDWRGLAAKLWRELVRRGIEDVREVVVLSDGAEWIEEVRALLLDGLGIRVVHILDLRHAEQHLWAVARACLGDDAPAGIAEPLEDLHLGRVDALLAALSTLPIPTTEAAELIATTVAYFAKRRAMLAYPSFRAQGYQIGSGLAESACKRLVTQRAKGPGMHWTTPGAQAIATLRAAHLTNRWTEVLTAAKVA
jgi:hypothetical protein